MIPSSFPKIMQLGLKPVQSIFQDEVEITEKLDGSQFACGLVDGELKFRSKGCEIFDGQVQDLFIPVVEYIKSIKHLLHNNVFLYGETFKKPKHNTLCYDTIPTHHFALFGVYDLTMDHWYGYEGIISIARAIDIDVVPLLFKGKIASDCTIKNVLEEFLDRTSYLGGAKVEGVVIKNYSRQMCIAKDIYTPFMAAKYVSESFKEVHRGRWNSEERPSGKWESFCATYNSTARWDKAVIHLQERGLLTDSPKDIGLLLREINNDIENEEKNIICNFLWNIHKKELLSAATKGLAEYYKQRLITDTYGETRC
jgi:hypothetical protein